jgi:hypothetical protein
MKAAANYKIECQKHKTRKILTDKVTRNTNINNKKKMT